MANRSLVIIDAQSDLFTVRTVLQQRYEVNVNHTKSLAGGLDLVRDSAPDYIVVNPSGMAGQVTEFLERLNQAGNEIPVIVAGDEEMYQKLLEVYSHIVGHIPTVYSESDLLPFLRPQPATPRGRPRGMALAERAALVQANQKLERRVQEALTLYQIGKAVASLTDLDAILARIVEAAVFLLRAEESSIMLRDLNTNELYLRSQKGLGEKQARGFNLRVDDSLIGAVVRSGEPVRLARDASEDSRLKVVTGYMVNALLYVPLSLRGEVIGVLGVSNQYAEKAFGKHDQRLLEALADYAALAIQVARQHKVIEQFRQERSGCQEIITAVAEIRQLVSSDDPALHDALSRIEDAAETLSRLADKETPTRV
jgi:hypothetical protein